MTRSVFGIGLVLAVAAAVGIEAAPQARKAAARPARAVEALPSPGAGPVIVMETVKGTIEFETYPNEAPKTVAHVLALVRRHFYNGLRIHRVVPGFVVQFGDPQTRDMTKQPWWGRGAAAGSGHAIARAGSAASTAR